MSKITELQEIEILKLYQDGTSLRSLAVLYNIDRGVIKRRLIKYGVKLRTLSEANMIYSFDESIFNKIDSHEKAYWLGFISADGNVYKNRLKIGLSVKDINHLELFKRFLKSDHSVSLFYPKVNGKIYESCEFSVRSDKLIFDLLQLNVTPNKSKTLIPANIDPQYFNSYILGIIDGDGCFHLNKKGQMTCNVTGSLEIINFIMNTLVKNCNITKTKIFEAKPGMNVYTCYLGGNNKVKKIVSFLYKDSPIFLKRKHDIIKHMFNG